MKSFYKLSSVVLFLIGFQTSICAQTVFYVDGTKADNSGDGKSWANAKKDLQNALDLADPTDEVWVKANTYKPIVELDVISGSTPNPSEPRKKIFRIPSGIAVYGGFDGSENALGDRDPENNETILSGDIGTEGDDDDNAYHVVCFVGATSQTVLDGFTISGGNANPGDFPNKFGGGIFNDGSGSGNSSNPQIANCTIKNNQALKGGAGIYNNGQNGTSSPTLTNCIIADNQATDNNGNGGGIYNKGKAGESSPVLTNCVLSGNYANKNGGGIFNIGTNGGTVAPILTNTIVWGNTADVSGAQIQNNTASPIINYSCVQNGEGGDSFSEGTDNLSSNPYFVDADNGNYRLNEFSVCINSGTASAPPGVNITIPTSDIAGTERPYEGGVNMGAYEGGEEYIAQTYYVDGTKADNSGDGLSWANAKKDLQNALDLAYSTDEIWVKANTYKPTVEFDVISGSTPNPSEPRKKIFRIPSGVAVYGGFDGSENDLGDRDPENNETILSGDIGTEGNDDDNAYHVVCFVGATSQTVLDGFTISGGKANHASEFYNKFGGGIYNDGTGGGLGSNPQIVNCQISNNYAENGGGGIYNFANNGIASPSLDYCDITSNQTASSGLGGGMLNKARGGISNPTLTNCNITENSAYKGAGIYNDGQEDGEASPTLSNCEINENVADNGGGGIFNAGSGGTSSPSLTNCKINNNQTTDEESNGGGIFNGGSDNGSNTTSLTDCEIKNNQATFGGGIYNHGRAQGNSSPVITGCEISGNQADVGGGIINDGSENGNCSPTITNCIISNNQANDGSGGGIHNYGIVGGNCSPTLINCLLKGNQTNSSGAGIINYAGEEELTGGTVNTNIINCVFSANQATLSGGAIHNYGYNGTCNTNITNTIIWDNVESDASKQIGNYTITGGSVTLAIGFSCVQEGDESINSDNSNGGTIDVTYETNNTSDNPSFVDAANGNYSLRGNSPCINAGTPNTSGLNLPSTDLAGNARIYNGIEDIIDIGAYEYQGDPEIPGLWTGAEDADWHNSNNWDDSQVPGATVDVTIPDTGNDPVISSAATCQNITIQANGELTINSSQTLDVTGNFTLEASADFTNSGTLKFSGIGCELKDNRTAQTSLGNLIVE